MARRSPAADALALDSTPSASAAPTIAEAAWQAQVAELAHTFGWRLAHFRPARTVHGWRTAGQYDAKGWPDLVLVHPDRQLVLFRELKADAGRLDDDQTRWRGWLTDAGADWDLWQPRDLELVVHVLAGDRDVRLVGGRR